MEHVTTDRVKSFWEANPLCASAIPYPLGSKEYFEYYNRLREDIESPAFSQALHEYKQHAGHKVLDVGCGNGYVLSKYAGEGAEVYGVDITEAAVRLCRQRFELLELRGQFQVANAEALPFPDAQFDVVCSMGVLHHTPDTAHAVQEIHRVLKPGGRLIVMFYHRNSILYHWRMPRAARRSGKSTQQIVNEVDGLGNPKGDVYSKQELGQLLRDFEQIEMFAGYLAADHIPKIFRWIPKSWLKCLGKRWGWNLYAKAWKPAYPARGNGGGR
jgi:ubiquinone/menaquinone biosynthesis C-methylase UbiE